MTAEAAETGTGRDLERAVAMATPLKEDPLSPPPPESSQSADALFGQILQHERFIYFPVFCLSDFSSQCGRGSFLSAAILGSAVDGKRSKMSQCALRLVRTP